MESIARFVQGLDQLDAEVREVTKNDEWDDVYVSDLTALTDALQRMLALHERFMDWTVSAAEGEG